MGDRKTDMTMSDPVDTDALRAALATAEDVIGNAISWAEHEGAGPDGDEQEAVDTLLTLAAASADEVDRLRDRSADDAKDRERIRVDFNARSAEASRLRTVIENAPHGDDCPDRFSWRDDETLPCTCWKSDAL